LTALQAHRDWDQVRLDVHRTLARFPPNIDDDERTRLQDRLVPLIVRVLHNNPELHYYQGFHDVCLTFLLICGEEIAYRICDRLACGVFRDFLAESLELTNRLLILIYPILRKADPELEQFLVEAELGTMFALSWLLTWYSHVINDLKKVARLYDLFLSARAFPALQAAGAAAAGGAD
jgi:TBC1 domain family member 20